jgi:hypothetical protein
LKFPPLVKFAEIIDSAKEGPTIDAKGFLDAINANIARAAALVAAEKFRWKPLEEELLELKDRLQVTANMLTITFISAEELHIKVIRADIAKWDDFLIPDVEPDVLQASVVKLAAKFPLTTTTSSTAALTCLSTSSQIPVSSFSRKPTHCSRGGLSLSLRTSRGQVTESDSSCAGEGGR